MYYINCFWILHGYTIFHTKFSITCIYQLMSPTFSVFLILSINKNLLISNLFTIANRQIISCIFRYSNLAPEKKYILFYPWYAALLIPAYILSLDSESVHLLSLHMLHSPCFYIPHNNVINLHTITFMFSFPYTFTPRSIHQTTRLHLAAHTPVDGK